MSDTDDVYLDDQPDIKIRQENLNSSHLFGTMPWKSALYKKARSVSKLADDTLLGRDEEELLPSRVNVKNIIYAATFGLILGAVYSILFLICGLLSGFSSPYLRLLRNMIQYAIWPFGYKLERHLTPTSATASSYQSTIFYATMYILAYPIHILIYLCSYLSIYFIPMGKLSVKLMRHLTHQPLQLVFNLPSSTEFVASADTLEQFDQNKHLIASIHNAASIKYFKYTIDGVNILFINMIPIVLFTLVSGFMQWIPPQAIFLLCIFSSVPLSYFLGLGVASISAQCSFGLAAIVNASFGSIIEIILYCIAITENKAPIVEGSFIGSLLAVLVLLPGLSMLVGGVKYKVQRFNSKSTGVTTTMIIMSLITMFTPTIMQISHGDPTIEYFNRVLQPLTWVCLAVMPTAYGIGLIFTLKTHVRHIYEQERSQEIPTIVTPDEEIKPRTRSLSVHQSDLHDAPNWSITKSIVVILCCTVLFSFIAELLVNCIDAVLAGSHISQKFIGVTLFALVPSVPEFVNAIAFALQDHVDLSLEIGLAYTVQVALLQLPCVILFSICHLYVKGLAPTRDNNFPLLFPTFDVFAVFVSVFMITYLFIEGKSNYFKGAVMVFSYVVLVSAYYLE